MKYRIILVTRQHTMAELGIQMYVYTYAVATLNVSFLEILAEQANLLRQVGAQRNCSTF